MEHTRAVSAQGHATATGVEVVYDGEMRMSGGSFAGYCSPLQDLPARSAEELADWTLALGGQLAAEGYRGPYSLDLVCTQDGTLYPLECNVRRTATTTAQAMVSRLTGRGRSAWSTGTVTAIEPMTFDETVGQLSEAGLDFQPGESEGVLLYADRPTDGRSWRYTALAPTHTRLTELDPTGRNTRTQGALSRILQAGSG
ncbi:peptide ligase PGM1-related protein [Streptomyces anulatus]|uniref:peptide ligase PGM1-related protein n=1 Tax=Streptomyces anulatus TaxID=1892 RepID=UPI003445F444